MLRTSLLTGAALLGFACSGSDSQEPSEPSSELTPTPSESADPTPSESANPTAPPDENFSFVLKQRPTSLSVDGKLEDWGDLQPNPLQSTSPPVSKNKQAYPPEPPGPSAPNPPTAGLRIAIALEKELSVAGRLGISAKDGLWLGVGALAPVLPAIGDHGRAGGVAPFDCEYEQTCCNDGYMIRGAKLTSELAAVCRKRVERYATLTAELDARFERVYRIDQDGVQYRDRDGKLQPVKDARVAFTKSDAGADFEATIPLSALPRMSQAPISALSFTAAPSGRNAPATATDEHPWTWLLFPKPVAFEPNAPLRELIFAQYADFRAGYSAALSYQLSDPGTLESMRRNPEWTAIEPFSGPIVEKYQKLGDVDVDLASIPASRFVISKGGAIRGHVELPVTEPADMCFAGERDGELHYIHLKEGGWDDLAGLQPPRWWVLIVRSDGTFTANALEQDQTVYFDHLNTTKIANRDCSQFGLRGPEGDAYGPGGVIFEQLWRWDKDLKKYVVTKREVGKFKRPQK
ncbi:MAG: hypothetical protein U0271_04335 [Polyangiaceae bacterium]